MSMGTLNLVPHTLCFFCYKEAGAKSFHNNVKRQIEKLSTSTNQVKSHAINVNNFINYLERYLDQGINGKPSNSLMHYYEGIDCCEDCIGTVNSFCQIYHQLRCLELKLEWKLQTLVNIMKFAGRVPSRLRQLMILFDRCVSDNDNTKATLDKDGSMLKTFKSFRQDVITKCTRKLSRSQPRILIENCCSHTPSVADNHDIDLKKPIPIISNPSIEMYFGWIMSFVAVAMLASTLVDMKHDSEIVQPNNEDVSLDLTMPSEDEAEIEDDQGDQAGSGDDENIERKEITTIQMQSGVALDSIPESRLDEEATLFPTTSVGKAESTDVSVVDDPDDNSSLGQNEATLENEPVEKPENMVPVNSNNGDKSVMKQIFACSNCTKSYTSQRNLTYHILTHHRTEKMWRNPKPGRYYCKVCKNNFIHYYRLQDHKRRSPKHQFLMKIYLKKRQYTEQHAAHNHEVGTGESDGKSKEISESNEIIKTNVGKEESIGSQEHAEKSIEPVPRPYDPRGKRLHIDFKSEQDIDDHDGNYSSDSRSSNYSSSSHEDEKRIKDISTRKKRIKRKRKFMSCQLDGCAKIEITNKKSFQQHQKMHEPGQYKCNFCEIVEVNIIKLSMLELNAHSPKNRVAFGEKVFCCARCDTEYFLVPPYQKHFASVHIWGSNNKRTKAKYIDNLSDGIDDDELVEDEARCKFCNEIFKDSYLLKLHKRKYHNGQGEDVATPTEIDGKGFVCPVVRCIETFKTIGDLETHGKLHGSFKCQFCDVVKEYAPDLALHETEHAVRTENPGTSNNLDILKKKIHCSRCSSSFSLKTWYIHHHMKKHLNLTIASETCHICGDTGVSKGYLTTHMRKVHGEGVLDSSQILKCDQCPAYFSKMRMLTAHQFNKHYSRKCPECNKPFRDYQSLMAHLGKEHAPRNPFANLKFICDVTGCPRRFATKRHLEKHKICGDHTSEDEPLICSTCGKEYKGKLNLYIHMKCVHADPTHVCTQCGKSFKTKLTLQFHMEYHKKPDEWLFQCSTCGKKVVDKQKLEQHLRTHTKEKPYKCPFCGKGLAHQHNWRNHLNTQHKEECDKHPEIFQIRKVDSVNRLSRKGSKKGDCLIAKAQQKC